MEGLKPGTFVWVRVRADSKWEVARYHSKLAWFVVGAVAPFSSVHEVGPVIEAPAEKGGTSP